MKFKEKLDEINACSEGVSWVGNKGFKRSWQICERGDWMLWYVARNKTQLGFEDMRLITKAKAKCALLVRHLMKDERSKKALDVAIKFGEGNATREELDASSASSADAAASADAYAASASAYAAYASTASSADAAASADAYAASASADAAAYASAYAAYASTASSADAAASSAAIKETLSKCAEICREVFKDVI